MLRGLLLSLVIGISAAAGASSLVDLLDLPAEAGERALRSMLLDVTRAGDRLVAVGEYGTVLYSDDDGRGWRQASVPVQVTLTAVHFPTPDKGWAVGHDAVILHSSDGGASWQKQLDGRQTGDLLVKAAEEWNASVEAIDPAIVGSDELMLLQDAAMMAMDEALREQEIGPNRPLLDVWFASDQRGFAIGAFNYFFVTEDGGKTWRDASSRLPNPEFLHLYGISPIAQDTLLLVGEFGLVMRSADGGQSWESLDVGYEGSLFSVNGGEGSAWIAGLRGNVFYTADAGDSWQPMAARTEATLLGSALSGEGRARFVGVGGIVVEMDLANEDVVRLSKGSQLTLASLLLADDSLILVGAAGITRLDADGTPTAPRYLGGAH